MALDMARGIFWRCDFHGDRLVRLLAACSVRKILSLGRIVELRRGRDRPVCLLPVANPNRPATTFAVPRESRCRLHCARHHRGVLRFVRLDGAHGRDVPHLWNFSDCLRHLSGKETAQADEADEIAAGKERAMRFKSLVLVLGLQTAWLLGTVVMQEN